MTDREMLELAAKAAGYTLREHYTGFPLIAEEINAAWNPLTDDGDALRLAVKLHLPVEAVIAFVAEREPIWKDDPYTATRLAIVKAAAEIGKAMV